MTIAHIHVSMLVEQAQNGNNEAFAELFRMFRRPVEKTVAYIVGSVSAEDVTQETFVKAFRHLRTLRETERFGPWLIRIARNTCQDWLTKRGQMMESSTDRMDDLADMLVDYSIHHTKTLPIAHADMRMDVESVLRAIPEKYMQPLYYHFLKELTIPEIALAFDLPISTIKWRIHRGLEMCRLLAVESNLKSRKNEKGERRDG